MKTITKEEALKNIKEAERNGLERETAEILELNIGTVFGEKEAEPDSRLAEMVQRGVKIYNHAPDGFYRSEGAVAAPKGFRWYSNRKSRFSDGYEQILVAED